VSNALDSRSKRYIKVFLQKRKRYQDIVNKHCLANFFHPGIKSPHAQNLPRRYAPRANLQPRIHRHLGVDVHLGGAAAMPGGKQDAAATALVGDILHAVHDIGNASEAGETAEAESPGAEKR
jgi:hypothetical protein